MLIKKFSSLKGVLFDWDGTLLNSHEADTAAYLAMFRANGHSWGLAELEQHYSPNWYLVYRAAKLPKHKWDDADQVWRENYAKQKPKLIAGRPARPLRASRTPRPRPRHQRRSRPRPSPA